MTRLMRGRFIWSGTLLLLASFAACILTGMKNAQSAPIIRRADVKLPQLAAETPPVRIALLSDIHLGNRGMEPDRLAKIVDQVNAAHPDLVLLAGDFVIGEDVTGAEARAKALTEPLSRLRAKQGVFAVLGNHDHWTAPEAIQAALVKAGITVLENEAERRGAFAVIGVGDRFSGHDNIARSLASARRVGGTPIVFTHSPDISPDMSSGIPLVLAGHTHCGQMVLPVVGPVIRYSHFQHLYNPRYRCGLVRDADRLTVVTGGVGSGGLPFRLGAMPDWWLLTVRP